MPDDTKKYLSWQLDLAMVTHGPFHDFGSAGSPRLGCAAAGAHLLSFFPVYKMIHLLLDTFCLYEDHTFR